MDTRQYLVNQLMSEDLSKNEGLSGDELRKANQRIDALLAKLTENSMRVVASRMQVQDNIPLQRELSRGLKELDRSDPDDGVRSLSRASKRRRIRRGITNARTRRQNAERELNARSRQGRQISKEVAALVGNKSARVPEPAVKTAEELLLQLGEQSCTVYNVVVQHGRLNIYYSRSRGASQIQHGHIVFTADGKLSYHRYPGDNSGCHNFVE